MKTENKNEGSAASSDEIAGLLKRLKFEMERDSERQAFRFTRLVGLILDYADKDIREDLITDISDLLSERLGPVGTQNTAPPAL